MIFLYLMLLLAKILNILADHEINKRALIFPPGSVMQLAVGIALPADIPHRIIYTNQGVMINYVLPTNVTELREGIAVRAAKQKSLLRTIVNGLSAQGILSIGCYHKIACFLTFYNHLRGQMNYELIKIVVTEIIEYLSSEGHPAWSIWKCDQVRDECNFLYPEMKYILGF